MAYEIPGFSWTLIAGEDLATSQFCGIDVDSSGEAVLPVQGGRCVGVVRNKPAIDETVTVVSTGITKASIGITGVTAGNNVTVDDDGTIIQATSGDTSIGIALQTTPAGEIGTVLLLIGQSVVTGS